jgi:hypothetical protein
MLPGKGERTCTGIRAVTPGDRSGTRTSERCHRKNSPALHLNGSPCQAGRAGSKKYFYSIIYIIMAASPDPPKKNYTDINEEDKIIFEHLFDRHKNLISYVNNLDTKFAQIISVDGVILSFIMFAAVNAKIFNLFILGIAVIIISMIIGAIGYFTRNFYVGASGQFFIDYDTFPKGVGIIELKAQLLDDIERNQKIYLSKAAIFDIMLPCLILGLILISLGFYV